MNLANQGIEYLKFFKSATEVVVALLIVIAVCEIAKVVDWGS